MSGRERIRKVPFGAGLGWLLDGGELIGRGGSDLLRIAGLLLVLPLLQLLPLIGPLVAALITPLFVAGMLNVSASIERGRGAALPDLLAGFSQSATRGSLVGLGLIWIVGGIAVVGVLVAWLAPQMDLAALAGVLNDRQAMDADPQQHLLSIFALFEGVNLFGGLALAATVLAVVLSMVYFAVPLVFFWRWPLFTALVWSLRAVLVNWSAFLAFGLVLFGGVLLLGLVFSLFSGLVALALGQAGAFLSQVALLALGVFVQWVLAAAQWKAFGAVFPTDSGHGGGNDAAHAPADDDGSPPTIEV